jgi:uncharacterized membrane protein YuzA (DUF378 family)
MPFNINVRIAGIVGLIAVVLLVSWLFYDKNQVLSVVFAITGLALAISFVTSEIYFKKQRHDAPWNYE